MAEKLKFYDLKKKKPFVTNKYSFKTIKGRRFAVANHDGCKCYRIVAKK